MLCFGHFEIVTRLVGVEALNKKSDEQLELFKKIDWGVMRSHIRNWKYPEISWVQNWKQPSLNLEWWRIIGKSQELEIKNTADNPILLVTDRK